MTTAAAPALATDRRTAVVRARPAALAAAGFALAAGVVSLLGSVEDHTQGLGAVSEVLVGLSFLAGAATLALLRPSGWRGLLWWLAPVGMTISGLSMLAVPVVGAEPPGWLFLTGVVPTLVGLVAAGVLGIGRTWRWWTGVGVALLLPIMFMAPLSMLWMSLIWISVAFASPNPRRARENPAEDGAPA